MWGQSESEKCRELFFMYLKSVRVEGRGCCIAQTVKSIRTTVTGMLGDTDTIEMN